MSSYLEGVHEPTYSQEAISLIEESPSDQKPTTTIATKILTESDEPSEVKALQVVMPLQGEMPDMFQGIPPELLMEVFKSIYPSDLKSLALTSNFLHNLSSDSQLYRSFADEIGCPITDRDSGLLIRKEINAFVEELRAEARVFENIPEHIVQIIENSNVEADEIKVLQHWVLQAKIRQMADIPADIAQLIDKPSFTRAEVARLQTWIKAWNEIILWDGLFERIPNLVGERPDRAILASSQATIDKAREFTAWCEQNRTIFAEQTSMELIGLGLTWLPPQIGLFMNLDHLELDQNRLTRLPKEIGLLTKLNTLHVKDNHLISLPSEITQLTELETVRLWDNKIASIPVGICTMPKLQILSLGCNRITKLPIDYSKQTLVMLDLSCNPVQAEMMDNWHERSISG